MNAKKMIDKIPNKPLKTPGAGVKVKVSDNKELETRKLQEKAEARRTMLEIQKILKAGE
jgi:hypothetical protein